MSSKLVIIVMSNYPKTPLVSSEEPVEPDKIEEEIPEWLKAVQEEGGSGDKNLEKQLKKAGTTPEVDSEEVGIPQWLKDIQEGK